MARTKRSDPAHVWTDKEIERIERLISKEYRIAHKEVTKKLEDYFAPFEKKDEKWQEWVAEGKETQEDYIKWRRGQLLNGKRWEEMCDTLAEDYTNASEIAKNYQIVILGKLFLPELILVVHLIVDSLDDLLL